MTHIRAGILTGWPSTSPFGYALGPPNPGTISVALETLGMRWAGFSPAKFVTHANILTSTRSTLVYTFASLPVERSPTAEVLHSVQFIPLDNLGACNNGPAGSYCRQLTLTVPPLGGPA